MAPSLGLRGAESLLRRAAKLHAEHEKLSKELRAIGPALLIAVRERTGISQSELARITSFARQHLNAVESGAKPLSVGAAAAIAEWLATRSK